MNLATTNGQTLTRTLSLSERERGHAAGRVCFLLSLSKGEAKVRVQPFAEYRRLGQNADRPE